MAEISIKSQARGRKQHCVDANNTVFVMIMSHYNLHGRRQVSVEIHLSKRRTGRGIFSQRNRKVSVVFSPRGLKNNINGKKRQ